MSKLSSNLFKIQQLQSIRTKGVRQSAFYFPCFCQVSLMHRGNGDDPKPKVQYSTKMFISNLSFIKLCCVIKVLNINNIYLNINRCLKVTNWSLGSLFSCTKSYKSCVFKMSFNKRSAKTIYNSTHTHTLISNV